MAQDTTLRIANEVKKIEAEAAKLRAERPMPVSSPRPTDTSADSDSTAATPQVPRDKKESLPRLKIQKQCNDTDWSYFVSCWKRFVDGTQLTKSQQILHLWASCSDSIQRMLHSGNNDRVTDPDTLLDHIRLIATKRKNNLVNIIELQKMGQGADETVLQYSTRLNGQANICDLYVPCSNCDHDVSFREKTIMYQMIRGLHDSSMQERILESAAQVEGGELSLTRVLKIAEDFELGKTTQKMVNNGGTLNRMSDYQSNKRNTRQESRQKDNAKTSQKQCGNCSKKDHSSKLNKRREKCPAFDKVCGKCHTNGHFTSQCRGGPKTNRQDKDKQKTSDKKPANSKVNEVKAVEPEQDTELGTMSGSWFLLNGSQSPNRELYEDMDKFSSVHQEAQLAVIREGKSADKIQHHIINSFGKWQPGPVQPHGKLEVNLTICASAPEQLGLPRINNKSTIAVNALANTGAQMCVADWNVAVRMGIQKHELLQPALKISVADNSNLQLIGANFLTIHANGESTHQLVYFATGVGELYLSMDALIKLKVIPADFPRIGSALSVTNTPLPLRPHHTH